MQQTWFYNEKDYNECLNKIRSIGNYDVECLANDPENLTLGKMFIKEIDEYPYILSINYIFAYGKADIIECENYDAWIDTLEKLKEEYKEDMIPADDPKSLMFGYLCKGNKTIYKIGIENTKINNASLCEINTIEEREELYKYK